MAGKSTFIGFMDGLPFWLKVVCCFFGLDILWSIYRIIKGYKSNDLLLLVIGIIWIFGSFTIGWILDLIWIFWKGKPCLC